MSDFIVSVEKVCKTVEDSTGRLQILRDVDFALSAGETAAIVGASGSGKSTLLSILAGLDVPSSGTVRIAGADMFSLDEDARAAVRLFAQDDAPAKKAGAAGATTAPAGSAAAGAKAPAKAPAKRTDMDDLA
jgi:ABC-type multidrug transport system ATPase subunit